MLAIYPVTTLDAPSLGPYRTLRRPLEHRRAGIFVAEGALVVRHLLVGHFDLVSALMTPQWLEELRPLLEEMGGELPVFVAAAPFLAQIVGYRLHQGVMAVARIPPSPPLTQLLCEHRPRLIVALDDLTGPENVGTIIRSAAALGAGAILAGETSATPWLRRAVRSSMGAVLHLPVVECADLATDLAEVRAQGYATYAAVPSATLTVWQSDLAGRCCVVLGHEGRGVRPAVAGACEHQLAIPMTGGVDSLNVAAAAAVILAEAARQSHLRSGDEPR